MKNNLSYLLRVKWLILLITPVFLVSCGGDDDPLPLPMPTFTYAPANIVVGEVVNFTNTSQNATAYQWNFGNGETSTDENPEVAFDAAGDYTVTLIATGPGGDEQASMTVTVEEPGFIYIDSYDYGLWTVDLTNGNASNMITLSTFGRGIALDTANNVLFYTDEDNGAIYSQDFGGGNETELAQVVESYSIALDVTGGKMYFPDRETSSIYVANLDGSDVQTLFDAADGFELPTDVALDLVNNKIYISDVGLESSGYAADGIWEANLDGSGLNQVIVGGGYSLAVDPEGGMLYFNDTFINGNISMAPLSDFNSISNFATLTESRCYGIEVFANRVYWTDLGEDLDDGRIYRAGLDGGSVEQLAGGLPEPRHFALYK